MEPSVEGNVKQGRNHLGGDKVAWENLRLKILLRSGSPLRKNIYGWIEEL